MGRHTSRFPVPTPSRLPDASFQLASPCTCAQNMENPQFMHNFNSYIFLYTFCRLVTCDLWLVIVNCERLFTISSMYISSEAFTTMLYKVHGIVQRYYKSSIIYKKIICVWICINGRHIFRALLCLLGNISICVFVILAKWLAHMHFVFYIVELNFHTSNIVFNTWFTLFT